MSVTKITKTVGVYQIQLTELMSLARIAALYLFGKPQTH